MFMGKLVNLVYAVAMKVEMLLIHSSKLNQKEDWYIYTSYKGQSVSWHSLEKSNVVLHSHLPTDEEPLCL